MAPVRKKVRPSVTGLASRRVESRHRRRSAAGARNSIERTIRKGREKDRTVLTPGTTAAARRIADRLRRASGGVDPLQLPIGEEADEAAVGRPEREGGILGPRERLEGERIERTDPEKIPAGGVLGDDDESRAVRREHGRTQGRFLGQDDRETHRACGLFEFECVSQERCRGQKQRHDRQTPYETFPARVARRKRRGSSGPRPLLGDPLQLGLQVVGALPALLRILGEARPHRVIQRRRGHGPDLRDRHDLFLHDGRDQRGLAAPGEGFPARRHLVEPRAKREDVGARVGMAV